MVKNSRDNAPKLENWKIETLQKIHSLSTKGFELFSNDFLMKLGYQDIERINTGNDEIIEVKCLLKLPTTTLSVYTWFMRTRNDVDRSQVIKFKKSVDSNGDSGLLISTSTIDANALHEAKTPHLRSIALIDGSILCNIMRDIMVGVSTTMDDDYFSDFDGPVLPDPDGVFKATIFGETNKYKYAITACVSAWNALIMKKPELCEELAKSQEFQKGKVKQLLKSEDALTVDKKYLRKKYRKLNNDWYLNINLSTADKMKKLQFATEYANFEFGEGPDILIIDSKKNEKRTVNEKKKSPPSTTSSRAHFASIFGESKTYKDAVTAYEEVWNELISKDHRICEKIYDQINTEKQKYLSKDHDTWGDNPEIRRLNNGWYTLTNTNTKQKRKFLQLATEYLGFTFGKGGDIDF